MTYSASIVNKAVVNGKLTVTIEFSNEENTVTETMNTTIAQDSNWIVKRANERCAQLEELDIYASNIALGQIDTSEESYPPPEETPKDLYKKRLYKFLRAQSALRMGLLSEDHDAFVALRQWLINNFNPDYLDLFTG